MGSLWGGGGLDSFNRSYIYSSCESGGMRMGGGGFEGCEAKIPSVPLDSLLGSRESLLAGLIGMLWGACKG